MFPGISTSEIESLLSRYSVESTVDILSDPKSPVATITVTQPTCTTSVSVTTTSSSTSTVAVAGQSSQLSLPSVYSVPLHASLETILAVHSRNTITQDSPVFIRVDKGVHGNGNTRTQLARLLSVEFYEEEGIDAGAIRLSFFEMLMTEINSQLFEGNPTGRVPKKDWGLSSVFEIAGMMVAHSVLNGGGALPCLLPAIYHGIATGEGTEVPPELMPCVDDFPTALAYVDLLQFVQKVCQSFV